MDWNRPYITMSKSYEAATVRALSILVEHGFVEHKIKRFLSAPIARPY